MAHIHPVYDTGKHFKIDAISKQIVNLAGTTTLVQYDHDSERLTFELPRYIDGHDMLTCNDVQVHYLNICTNRRATDASSGVYAVDDLQVSPTDDQIALCSWLISHNATANEGTLSFLLRFVCRTDDVLDYVWNTAIFKDIIISKGMYNAEQLVEDYSDIFTQWLSQIDASESNVAALVDEANEARDEANEARDEANEARDDVVIIRNDVVDGEAARIRAEATRQNNEEIRVRNNDLIIEVENERGTAESLRAEAEGQRSTAEGERNTAESLRAEAEGQRSIAEGERNTAEGQRSIAEGERNTAEGQRNTAEGQRNTAEGQRNTAESLRAEAEGARELAEQQRVETQEIIEAAITHYPYIGENKHWFVWSDDAWVDTNIVAEALNDDYIETWYQGVDLTAKFADEIAALPYNGDPWAWIKARIAAHDYTGVHVNDYIPFTTTNNTAVKACVAGIDTYYRYGDSSVGHHIDFISRDCWPTTVQMNKTNYNNGLIPVEKLSGDGTATAFAMTRQMTAIDNITVDDEQVTTFTYDFATSTVTFDAAPASGSNNIIVTGTGTRHPWLASNAYAYLNSLAMQVPNGTGANPAITQVDYTADGVYYYLPAALKSVIVDKRILLPTRYSATGALSTDNSWAWNNMGRLWLPSEVEIAGCPIWGDKGYGAGGFVQYPVFACNMNRLKGLGNGGSRGSWWTISAYSGGSTYFVFGGSFGHVSYHSASGAVGAPVCFRIA